MRKLTILALVLIAPSAAAASDARIERLGDHDYAYRFGDDPLSADRRFASGALLRVRRMPARPTLIRPRLHFVPEMLKSVENL